MPSTDEPHESLCQVEHQVLRRHKGRPRLVTLTQEPVQHLQNARRVDAMADAGTELAHESGHLHGGWDAFASHIAKEKTYTPGPQAHGVIEISAHPPGRHGDGVELQLRQLWERSG